MDKADAVRGVCNKWLGVVQAKRGSGGRVACVSNTPVSGKIGQVIFINNIAHKSHTLAQMELRIVG